MLSNKRKVDLAAQGHRLHYFIYLLLFFMLLLKCWNVIYYWQMPFLGWDM